MHFLIYLYVLEKLNNEVALVIYFQVSVREFMSLNNLQRQSYIQNKLKKIVKFNTKQGADHQM